MEWAELQNGQNFPGKVKNARGKEEADGDSWEMVDKSPKTAFLGGFVCV